MNYRHAFHAGNPADVFKHTLLVRLIRAFQRKETGFLFVDTHAGRGRYDLSLAAEGDSRPRQPEWPEGIGALWDRDDVPSEVQDYLSLVRRFDRGEGNLDSRPRFYPGSPRISLEIRRPRDRLELWERHPAECGALRASFENERRVAVHEADGFGALRACLPPPERRALVLIDPPFEAQEEWSHVASALGEGMDRFPGGTYAVWYPLTERAGSGAFLDSVRQLKAPALSAELRVNPDSPGLRASGVVILNPPWQFEAEAETICAYLAKALSRDDRSQGSARWIVPR